METLVPKTVCQKGPEEKYTLVSEESVTHRLEGVERRKGGGEDGVFDPA